MNPADIDKIIVESGVLDDDLGARSAAQAGMPAPAVLARMANEFYRGVFGESDAMPSQYVEHAAGIGDIPAIAPHLSRAELNALPASLPVEFPQTPGLPTGIGAADFSTVPSFSFLEDARSLFAAVPAFPVQAVVLPSTTKIPTETEFRDFAPGFPGVSIPGVPAEAASGITVPQVPAAPVPLVRNQGTDTFGFFKDLNPLEPLNVVPSLVPAGSDLEPVSAADLSSVPFDVQSIRRDFPILQEQVNSKPLIWLDNAATTQKPKAVIDRLKYFYEHENSNIHRAAHTLAARSTDAYEAAREKVRRFLGAASTEEIVFVRGATEGINLVAQSWGRRFIQKDDEIVITWLEHHANIVPWQMLCAEKGARLKVAPVDDHGQILLEEYEKLLGPRTKLVSLAHVSNALGTVTPVGEMVEIAHRHGAKVLVDGAQAVSHLAVDVQAYDCDFYVFSGHKVFAPTGIGVVYGKKDVLDAMPPWQSGGNMISDVTFERTTYHAPPQRFEAGTGNIADAVGLGAAIDYLDRIGMANVSRYEHDLLVYGTDALRRIPGLRLIGTAQDKASVLSFVMDGFRTEEIGKALSNEGIAVRAGHHCAQPILRRFGLESTVRPSLAFYNTCEEIDALVAVLWNLKHGRHGGL